MKPTKRSTNDRGCPGGDSEPDKVIFNVYNICIIVQLLNLGYET